MPPQPTMARSTTFPFFLAAIHSSLPFGVLIRPDAAIAELNIRRGTRDFPPAGGRLSRRYMEYGEPQRTSARRSGIESGGGKIADLKGAA
jgi:hypothetical protein